MFKGDSGARLKREIVRRTEVAGNEEEMEQIKKRPTEEQKKIRVIRAAESFSMKNHLLGNNRWRKDIGRC
jgi:hypothetical protein